MDVLHAILFGIWNISWWQKLLFLLLLTHVTIAAVTIYLHRCQTHRSLELHPIIAHFFRFWLWLTTGMITKQWVAIHRKHHAKCETVDDPHSPQVRGVKKVLLEGVELYKEEAVNVETLERYGEGTPDDPFERKVYSHNLIGINLMLGIDVLLFGLAGGGPIVWAIQMLWIPIFAAGVINGLGHWSGYRSYETKDASTNIFPWGILIGGEELHNNHHQYPSSPKLSAKWWEFDIGWIYICLLRVAFLAKLRTETGEIHASKHGKTNLHRLLNRYRRKVVIPLAKKELPQSLYREVKHLFARQSWCVVSRKKLDMLLSEHEVLKRVWQLRTEFVEALEAKGDKVRVWCEQARASKLIQLEQFALRVQRYFPSVSR